MTMTESMTKYKYKCKSLTMTNIITKGKYFSYLK